MIKNKKKIKRLTIDLEPDIFKMLAFLKFKTNKSYRDIIASLIEELYKDVESETNV